MANLNIAIKIAADTAAATGPMAGIRTAITNLGQAAKSGVSGLANFGAMAGGALLTGITALGVGAAGAAVGLTALTLHAASAADELVELSDKTGLSTAQLQEYQYIGEQTGTSLETVTGGLAKLIRSMDSARGGTGAASEAFRALGINVVDSNGQLRDSQTVFGQALDALNGVGNETERDALAMALFGKSAQELNPLISAGSDGIAEMQQRARDLGVVMSDQAVLGLAELNDMVAGLKLGFQGWTGEMAANFLPIFRAAVGTLEDGMGRLAGLSPVINALAGTLAAGDLSGSIANIRSLLNQLGAPPAFIDFVMRVIPLAASQFNEFNTQLENSTGPERLAAAIDRITGAFGGVPTSAGAAGTAASGLGVILDGVVGTIELVASGAEGVAWAFDKTNAAITIAQGLWQQLGVIISQGTFVDHVETIATAFGELDKEILVSLGRVVVAVQNGIIAATPQLAQSGVEMGQHIIEGMIRYLTGGEISSQVSTAINSILTGFNPLAQAQAVFNNVSAVAGGQPAGGQTAQVVAGSDPALLNAVNNLNTSLQAVATRPVAVSVALDRAAISKAVSEDVAYNANGARKLGAAHGGL